MYDGAKGQGLYWRIYANGFSKRLGKTQMLCVCVWVCVFVHVSFDLVGKYQELLSDRMRIGYESNI